RAGGLQYRVQRQAASAHPAADPHRAARRGRRAFVLSVATVRPDQRRTDQGQRGVTLRGREIMRTSRRELAGLLLLPAALLLAPMCAVAQADQPIKIGVVLSLSGPAAVFGLPERNAITAIQKEVAGAGGKPFELVFFDDKTNPTEAARGVTQLINDEKVVAIIGPGTGGNILAAGPIAERLKVP